MNDVHITFGPIDTRNPGCGYQITIERARTGEVLLRTSRAPDTGFDLANAADCMRVAQMYVR